MSVDDLIVYWTPLAAAAEDALLFAFLLCCCLSCGVVVCLSSTDGELVVAAGY